MVKVPQAKLDSIQPLDHARFERMRVAEFRPGYDLIGLKYLRDKAGNERNLRELYRGRALYELLQNADDAGARRAVYVLSHEGLAFAHNGRWFTVDNFRSLADGWSDKNPDQCIGHKGLGFRSVLDITPAPHLLKVEAGEFFGVKWTWALNNGHVQEVLKQQPELRSQYDGWTRQGQLCCPVMAIPGIAKKPALGACAAILDGLLRGDYEDSYTTLFWFPARDPDISPAVLSDLSPIPVVADESGRRRLHDFVAGEVSALLPFLTSVSEVRVCEGRSCIASVRIPAENAQQEDDEITVLTETRQGRSSQSFFRLSFDETIPSHIKNLADTPKAVKEMNRARLSLLVNLDDGIPVHNASSTFHVYFPTKEPTGMGFVIHGDFYVEPHRTHLMKGGYNEWLLERVAKVVAGEFLTSLLHRYRASSVFEGLSPTESTASESGGIFRQRFAKLLQERVEPFIPTGSGLLGRKEVLLPPAIDMEGFWASHFTGDLSELVEEKKAFLLPAEDGRRTRAFLSLARADVLKPEELIDFIEVVSQKSKSARWWYECYTYLSNEETVSKRGHDFFAGRKLIPAGKAVVVPVPLQQGGVVVSLPPTGDVTELTVPECFAPIFVFVDTGVARLLQSGEDTIRSWVLDRLHISRFEATELLPRAIGRIAPQILSGALKMSVRELAAAWEFIRTVTDASRMIKASEFWDAIGRFPLPLGRSDATEKLASESMVAAFLSYWPDSWVEGENCLWQVEGLRRIDEGFLNALVSGNTTREQLHQLFSQVGVSKAPKLLRYSRIIPGDELLADEDGPAQFRTDGFTGLRQSDINKIVVKTILCEQLWADTVESFASCGHGYPRSVQTLTILEGLRHCTEKAAQEFRCGDPNWLRRLWALLKDLPLTDMQEVERDSAFCRGGGGGGHDVPAGRYVERQLHTHRWLPTSLGPADASECFLRSASRRLISSGMLGEELGDKLLAYVVVDNINTLARLEGLSIETLDDPDSASIPALVRALSALGERLGSDWGQQEVLRSAARWRLIRGAIQEIYRRLNQHHGNLEFPDGIRFATRSPSGVGFCSRSLYYADPGSAIEQAFAGVLRLFDADRPYARLFEQIPVTRLLSSGEGKTVEERLLTEAEARTLPHLRDEIADKLSPFLLAPIIARSERQKDIEVIVRRLRERFEVKGCDHLTVSFSLVAEPTMERSVDFAKFYLQRRVVRGEEGVEEAHYVLYCAGGAQDSIAELDADALGQVLAPVFFVDRVTEDLAGLFPRITYRYQQANGVADEMQDFLYYQLGISREAQESAMSIVSGDAAVPTPMPVAPPLPMKVITKPAVSTEQHGAVRQSIERHQQTLNQQLTEILRPLVDMRTPDSGLPPVTRVDGGSTGGISPEQQARGRRGEEEIKRRLQLPGGWAGFVYVADRRGENCGYDFAGKMEERPVQLEVKTFTSDGRVIVTARELRAAAEGKDDYYLIGVLDDGIRESEWSTTILHNPIQVLLSRGDFDIEAKLHAPAADIFEIDTA